MLTSEKPPGSKIFVTELKPGETMVIKSGANKLEISDSGIKITGTIMMSGPTTIAGPATVNGIVPGPG